MCVLCLSIKPPPEKEIPKEEKDKYQEEFENFQQELDKRKEEFQKEHPDVQGQPSELALILSEVLTSDAHSALVFMMFIVKRNVLKKH